MFECDIIDCTDSLLDELRNPYKIRESVISILFYLLILVGIYAIIAYFLYSIGMYKIAKRVGYPKPWLAWIPIVNGFMIMVITNPIMPGILRGRFVAITIAATCLAIIANTYVAIPNLDVIGKYAVRILTCYGFYVLALNFTKKPGVHMVVALVTASASIPFQVFMLRNNKFLEPYMSPDGEVVYMSEDEFEDEIET